MPLIGLVDTAVVGHLDDPTPLAAVALGSGLVSVAYFLFSFLRQGTTALAAQAQGAGDAEELVASLVRGTATALTIGLALVAASSLVIAAGNLLLAPPADTSAGFAGYVGVRLLAAPLALAQTVVLGWFLGQEDARTPLLVTAVTSVLNAALAVAFVTGLGLAERGVGGAAALAETAGFLLATALARKRLQRLGARPAWKRVLSAAALRRLFRVNRDIFLRSLFLQVAYVLFQAIGSRQGEIVVAANAVLMQFFMLAAYAMDGFANAAEPMVGRAVGAGDPKGLGLAVHAAQANGWTLAAVLTITFALTAESLIHLLTGLAPVREAASLYRWWAVLMPLAGIGAFIWDGVFFGATRTRALRDGMLLALLVLAAACAALVPLFGNHGLLVAFLLFLAARGAILGVYWRRGGGSTGFAVLPSTPS